MSHRLVVNELIQRLFAELSGLLVTHREGAAVEGRGCLLYSKVELF